MTPETVLAVAVPEDNEPAETAPVTVSELPDTAPTVGICLRPSEQMQTSAQPEFSVTPASVEAAAAPVVEKLLAVIVPVLLVASDDTAVTAPVCVCVLLLFLSSGCLTSAGD